MITCVTAHDFEQYLSPILWRIWLEFFQHVLHNTTKPECGQAHGAESDALMQTQALTYRCGRSNNEGNEVLRPWMCHNSPGRMQELFQLFDSVLGAGLRGAHRPFIKRKSPACFAIDPILVGDVALISTNVDEADIVGQAATAQQHAVSKSHQKLAQLQADGSMMIGIQSASKR